MVARSGTRPSQRGDDAREVQRLREMDAFKTHFLNMAAHELSTPLTPTRLQLHLLQSGALGALDARQLQAVRIAERNVGRLASLVAEILEVARLQGGGLRFNIESFDLGAAVTEAVDAYAEAARGLDVRLHADCEEQVVLRTDRERLLQVLMNLLSNAIKFTKAGGTVSVAAQSLSGDKVAIEVRDTGAGLTEEQIGQLFRPFAQVHDPMAVTSPGAGLGLYICRSLVEAMGGTITAASEGLGKGSTFRILLSTSHEAPVVHGIHVPSEPLRSDASRRLRELI